MSVINLCRDHKKYIPNSYEMHRRLWMAFPTDAKKRRDPDFFEQYLNEDFRNDSTVLFHTEFGRNTVLVQSGIEPDWRYCFSGVEFLLTKPPQVREINHEHGPNDRFRFVLRVNPTIRRSSDGKKVAVPPERISEWFSSKGGANGFALESLEVKGCWRERFLKKSTWVTVDAAECHGIFIVTDPDKFDHMMRHGIGTAKCFGFGLPLILRAPKP